MIRQVTIKHDLSRGSDDSIEDRQVWEQQKVKINELLVEKLQCNISWLKDGSITLTTEKPLGLIQSILVQNDFILMPHSNHKVLGKDENGVDPTVEILEVDPTDNKRLVKKE